MHSIKIKSLGFLGFFHLFKIHLHHFPLSSIFPCLSHATHGLTFFNHCCSYTYRITLLSCCDKHHNQKDLGKESVLTVVVHHEGKSGQKYGCRDWYRNHEGQPANLLPKVYSTCFLIQAKTTSSRLALTTVGWALPRQSLITKCSRPAYMPIWWEILSQLRVPLPRWP